MTDRPAPWWVANIRPLPDGGAVVRVATLHGTILHLRLSRDGFRDPNVDDVIRQQVEAHPVYRAEHP